MYVQQKQTRKINLGHYKPMLKFVAFSEIIIGKGK
ncbi:hypothetical protein BAC2_02094 [uncultured bacterium]|nr:hypothetical protein BAC2_02094 [uncultured bacterium]